jgi:hypothetical protein
MNVTAPSWFSSPKGFWLGTSGNLVYFNIYNGTSSAVCNWDDTTGSIIKANSGWIHVIATRKSSTGSKLYVNGVLKASNTSTLDPTYDSIYQTPSMGALYVLNSIGGVVNNSVFSPVGTKIDGLSVWKKELTQSEVTELYNSGNGKQLTVATPIVTNGLVLNLDASRTSSYPNAGTTWYDISGNGNNGTMTNGPLFGTASGGQITFDGINDYVDCGLSNISLPTNITLSAWINQSTLSGYKNIITKEDSTGTGLDYGLTTSPNGNLYFWFHNGSYKIHETSTGVINSTNKWYNVVSVFDDVNNIVKMYVNGVEIYNQSETTSLLAHVNSKLFIGWRNSFLNGQSFYGNIANTQIYNRALSQSEITQNYNATKSRFGL